MTEGKIRRVAWVMVLVAMVAAGAAIYGNRLLLIDRAYQAGLAAIEAEDYQGALDAIARWQDQHIAKIEHVRALAYLKSSPPLQDIDLGLSLQRAAAARGLMRARYFLAAYLLDQEDPPQADIDEALPHLRAAADCGMPMANFELAEVYSSGALFTPDYRKAYYFSERAVFGGYADAIWQALELSALIVASTSEVIGSDNLSFSVWALLLVKNGDARANEKFGRFITNLESNFPLDFEIIREEAARKRRLILPPNSLICRKLD